MTMTLMIRQQQQRHEQQQKQEGPDARIQGNDDFNYQVTNLLRTTNQA